MSLGRLQKGRTRGTKLLLLQAFLVQNSLYMQENSIALHSPRLFLAKVTIEQKHQEKNI